MNRCIMAATDAEAGAVGALRCAKDAAVRTGLPLEVISVCEPTHAFGYDAPDLVAGVMAEMAEACRNIRRAEVAEQLAHAGVRCHPFIDVEIGAPPESISRAAIRRGASMVIVGRGRRGLERVLTDEAALRLMQASHVPILSVPESYADLPRRALAAIDFTSYSIDAARSALTLLGADGELHLVHVVTEHPSQGFGSWRSTSWSEAIREETQARLDAAAAELSRVSLGVTVHTHLLQGRPVHAVLRLAQTLEVDMLAAGTNGYGFLGRLLMGSVATQLVRRSDFLTLISPPRGVIPGGEQLGADLRRDRRALVREAMAAVSEQAS